MATEIAVNCLIEKLLKLEVENVELMYEVRDVVTDLVADLQELKSILTDVLKINGNYVLKESMIEMRSLVHKAEDSIDKFIVEAKQHDQENIWSDVPYWLIVRDVAKEIQFIRRNLKEIRARFQDHLETVKSNNRGEILPPIKVKKEILLGEDEIVGIDEEIDIVFDRVIGGSMDLEVVPITGMVGLGKSTLAWKVFNDPRLNFNFFFRIWISVSWGCKKDILLSIIERVISRRRRDEVANKTEDELINEVCTCLEKGGGCLLVLDDVGNKDIIDFIKDLLPKNNKSHRIMMTTRHIEVASSFGEDIHIKKFLSDDDSMLLLQRRVFGTESFPPELEEIGKSIAQQCIGLPHAIVVIARALQCCHTKQEWELVNQDIANHLMDRLDADSLFPVVRMSYDLLPFYQKACFLYCATFPQGFEIPAWRLIRLWIAEGYVPSDKNLTLEEKAEDCLNDLITKKLLTVTGRTSDGHIKSCRIQNIFYVFCKEEAYKEGFLEELMPSSPYQYLKMRVTDPCRCLCIDSSKLTAFLSSKPSMELVSSFLCFSSKHLDMPPSAVRTFLMAFRQIKVLEVEPIKFKMYPKELVQLLHLRYLSLSGDFAVLPESFGRLWNLETLIIHITESTLEIKADIWSMLRLRHVHANVPAKLPSPGVPLATDYCIQTLSVISPESCTRNVFSRARYLRKLGIRGNVVSLFDANTGGWSHLAELKRLENLKLVNDGSYSNKVINGLFPKTLRKLTFSGTRLDWSEMTKVGQLESLEVLKLKEYAFEGDFWEPETGGFRSLLVLCMERTDVKIWRASDRSFPRLRRLVLKSCEHLEAVPECLADIPSFQEMKLENTHKAAVRSARKIQQKKLECSTSSSFGFQLSVFPPDE